MTDWIDISCYGTHADGLFLNPADFDNSHGIECKGEVGITFNYCDTQSLNSSEVFQALLTKWEGLLIYFCIPEINLKYIFGQYYTKRWYPSEHSCELLSQWQPIERPTRIYRVG